MTSLRQTYPEHAVERPAWVGLETSARVVAMGEVRESRKRRIRLLAVKVFFIVVTSVGQIKPKLSNFWAKV